MEKKKKAFPLTFGAQICQNPRQFDDLWWFNDHQHRSFLKHLICDIV